VPASFPTLGTSIFILFFFFAGQSGRQALLRAAAAKSFGPCGKVYFVRGRRKHTGAVAAIKLPTDVFVASSIL